MGLRTRLKNKIRKIIDAFSGEYSQEAPETIEPYQKGKKDENVEVVMARLNRPKGGSGSST